MHKNYKLFTIHKLNYFILMHKNYYDYTCTRWAVFSPSAKRSICVIKHELPFSTDLIPIDVRIHTFLNKTPKYNFLFESFPLVQFLLIFLFVEDTYIRNGCLASVAYSQGRASHDSRALLRPFNCSSVLPVIFKSGLLWKWIIQWSMKFEYILYVDLHTIVYHIFLNIITYIRGVSEKYPTCVYIFTPERSSGLCGVWA